MTDYPVFLERIENEVVASVEATITWIVIVPLLIVDRNSHLLGISVIETVGALEIILAPKVLGVVNVRIVVESIPIDVRR